MMRLLSRIVFGLALAAGPVTASSAGYGDWIAVVVAGDNHAQDGAISEVFDNGRRDIANGLAAIGIPRDNIAQFSVSPNTYRGTLPSNPGTIASTLWDLSSRTSSGCFVYVTSHGTPQGVLVGTGTWSPEQMAVAIDNACGGRPSVVVVSACYSGVFVRALAAPERLVMTAARPDRASFGCGNTDRYTYFDQCVLQSFSGTGDFAGLAQAVQTCVAAREKAMGASPPSEPQVALGASAAAQLPRWR